jgi:F-type H+-transporting ATPase subunit epsilon
MIRPTAKLAFRVLLPTHELVSLEVVKVTAEADDGLFCILPRHIDFVATLVPSVLSYWTEEQNGSQKENYLAVNQGVLVKYADTITVSALDGVRSDNLEQLQNKVEQHFLKLDEHERKARTALARLEAATLRGFRQLQERIND